MNPAAYGPVFIPVIAVIGFLVHLGVGRTPRTTDRVLTLALLWGLGMAMGVGEVVTAGSHIVAPEATALQIGFPPGNPFQWEVAMANLAFAVLGLACLAVRRLDFWLCATIGYLVYFWGCGVGHVVQYVAHDDTAPYNWGPIVPVVFLEPLVLLALVIALRAVRAREHGVHERTRAAEPTAA